MSGLVYKYLSIRLVQQQTENQPKQNKKEDQKTLKPALTETKKEKKVSERQAPEVSLVAAAISNNNVAGLVNLLKEDNTRIKVKVLFTF